MGGATLARLGKMAVEQGFHVQAAGANRHRQHALLLVHDHEPLVLIDNAVISVVERCGLSVTANLHYTACIERKIDMRLHLAIDGDAAMGQNGFCLVATDAVKRLHHKIEQFGWLFHLTDNGFIVIAGHAVVMSSIGHFLVKYVSQA